MLCVLDACSGAEDSNLRVFRPPPPIQPPLIYIASAASEILPNPIPLAPRQAPLGPALPDRGGPGVQFFTGTRTPSKKVYGRNRLRNFHPSCTPGGVHGWGKIPASARPSPQRPCLPPPSAPSPRLPRLSAWRGGQRARGRLEREGTEGGERARGRERWWAGGGPRTPPPTHPPHPPTHPRRGGGGGEGRGGEGSWARGSFLVRVVLGLRSPLRPSAVRLVLCCVGSSLSPLTRAVLHTPLLLCGVGGPLLQPLFACLLVGIHN